MTDPLDDALARLTAHDVDPWRAETGRRIAQAAMRRAHHGTAAREFLRVLEPVLVAGVSAAYLAWAADAVIRLLAG
jgi:hypothetical protein